ncbi:MAG: VacJ family lipoprotein [Sutterellaceae bacterium]|nr:VacJ family lipoprotein [Sutterellaceae bacterium]
MKSLRQIGLSALCVSALMLGGCAQIPEGSGSDPSDPWETMNRHTFAFNNTVDTYVLRPVAKGYEAVMPQFARDRISNIYVNLGEPSNVMNNALQGKGEGALVSLFRFLINTTLGVGGMFDVAGTAGGQPVRNEDFGQTLAVWGVPSGPYFVIPFLGPSTVRDTAGLGVDYLSQPQTYTDGGWIEWGMWGLYGLDTRARLIPATDLLKDAVDPYVMAREGFLSMRNNAVWDGNPPFEFPKDEFEDEEDDVPQEPVK